MAESRQCRWCSGPIGPLTRADVVTCSTACRVALHRSRPPAELRGLDRWVRFSAGKVPLTPAGEAASSTARSTWSSWSEVEASSAGVGVGFVLDGDGIVCLDVDDCLVGGRLVEWARPLLEVCPPTFVEVSPSGSGLHVWGRAGGVRAAKVRLGDGLVEVYGRARFITVTSRRFRSAPARLADLGEVLDWLR